MHFKQNIQLLPKAILLSFNVIFLQGQSFMHCLHFKQLSLQPKEQLSSINL